MLYCESCMHLTEGKRCTKCRNKRLREVKHTDPIFLTTRDVVWAGAVEELLKENDVPVMVQNDVDGGMSLIIGGMSQENYHIFVPYSKIEKAQQLLADVDKAAEAGEFAEFDEMDALDTLMVQKIKNEDNL